MTEAGRGRTTLLIAHRLSTIRSTDLIMTLFDGRVAETGATQRRGADTKPGRDSHDRKVACAGTSIAK